MSQIDANAASSFPVVVVTGLSGSGKTTALNVFEDLGFFTVDGLPSVLASQMAGMFKEADLAEYKGLALGMDIRNPDFLQHYEEASASMGMSGERPQLIFFEARPEVLMQRYAQTRRPHPLEKKGYGLEQALEMERFKLERLRASADLVIDTSSYSIHDLRRTLQSKWDALKQCGKSLRLHIISFGFKYGTPAEADMMLDVRFIQNPYFVPELKEMSGRDAPVAEYVLGSESGKAFLGYLKDFFCFILEQFEQEGRFRFTVAVGCTGGRHRSVAVSEALAKIVGEAGFCHSLEHRHLKLG